MRHLVAVLALVALAAASCGGDESRTTNVRATSATSPTTSTTVVNAGTTSTTASTAQDPGICDVFGEIDGLDAESNEAMEEFNRKAAQITSVPSEEEAAQLLVEFQAAIRAIDNRTASLADAYDRAIEAAEPDVGNDLATMRDGSSAVWELVMLPILDAESVEEWLELRQRAAEDPSFVELVNLISEAGDRLDEFTIAECGFQFTNPAN